MPFRPGQDPNRPLTGSTIRVEPIRGRAYYLRYWGVPKGTKGLKSVYLGKVGRDRVARR